MVHELKHHYCDQTALKNGMLKAHPSLSWRPPTAAVVAPEAGDETPVDVGDTTVITGGTAINLQVDTPGAASVSATVLTGAVLARQYGPLHVGLLYLPEFGGAVLTAVALGIVLQRRADSPQDCIKP